MADVVDRIGGQLAALTAILDRLPANRDDGSVAGAVGCASDPDLIELLRVARAGTVLFESISARVAGEIARRSAADGEASLAKRLGESNAAKVVAKEAGITPREAGMLIGVGEETAPRMALSGESLPATREHVAAALEAGTISIEIANLITKTIKIVRSSLTLVQIGQLEQQLVGAATSGEWTMEYFTRYCRQLPDRLDPDGAEPREDALRELAGVKEIRLSNGMLRIIADLHPEAEGWWRAALDAKTAPRRRRFFANGEAPEQPQSDADEATRDHRLTHQHRLDALMIILKQSLKHDGGDVGGTAVTMLVTIPLEDLTSGLGSATIEGVDLPISAATARRLAVEANLVPQVLGSDSAVLDQGVGRRFFNEHQRRALATRDKGCVWPGCNAPPVGPRRRFRRGAQRRDGRAAGMVRGESHLASGTSRTLESRQRRLAVLVPPPSARQGVGSPARRHHALAHPPALGRPDPNPAPRRQAERARAVRGVKWHPSTFQPGHMRARLARCGWADCQQRSWPRCS